MALGRTSMAGTASSTIPRSRASPPPIRAPVSTHIPEHAGSETALHQVHRDVPSNLEPTGRAAAEVDAHTDKKKRSEDDAVRNGLAHILLHPPGEVDHAEGGCDVGEAMQALPAG